MAQGQHNIGINEFVADFDGGSRPTLYKVEITGDSPANFDRNLSFYCKATSLPASTLGEIIVPYMGRQIKVPGDRTFEDWTVTILNTEDMNLRSRFESWNQYYNGTVDNRVEDGGPFWGHVATCSATVTQLNRKGDAVKLYQLAYVFPKEVASIELAYDQVDTVSEFQVTFGYTYFIQQSGSNNAPNPGGRN